MVPVSGEVKKLCSVVRAFPLTEGENRTKLSCLVFYRSAEKEIEMPQTDDFYIYLVLDGSLRLYTPSGILDYMPGQYSVSKIDTPASGRVLTFAETGDFLALAVQFTLNDVLSVVLELDGNLAERISNGRMDSKAMSASDAGVISAVYRLVSVMNETIPLAFMENNIKREIIFYILCGSCGAQFLQSVINIRQTGEIYEINSWIKENFRHSFTVEELAEKRNMSVSLFHQKFKSAVGMGPLQCQKRLRLTEARRLMLDENKNVTEASLEVGYESVSQFTRDYRKMFGLNPKEDITGLRGRLKK